MNYLMSGLVLMGMVASGPALADTNVDEHRPADAHGMVEISNITGMVEVDGWDKAEVAVTGSFGSDVERVDIASSYAHTTIRVIPRTMGHSDSGSAKLVVHVPAKSTVSATLVSADLKIAGVQGDAKLQSISGNMTGEVGGSLRASSVSGDLKLTARSADVVEVKSVSGDLTFTGGGGAAGSGSGEVEISTVSGTVKASLGSVHRGRFKSVSGDLHVGLTLSTGAQLDGESVSGTVDFELPTALADASVDVKTMSGDIVNCFGPKPVASHYGAGSRLMYRDGSGATEVRITTQSGDVHLCNKGGRKVS